MPPKTDQLRDLLRNFHGLAPLPDNFNEPVIDRLTNYYGMALKWNKRLHLTTLTQPEQFFERHILESACCESLILPSVKEIWDLGSGLGIPGMVIAILRVDLDVNLVEANRKKVVFLEEVSAALNLKNLKVHQARMETLSELSNESCLTVRAIEKMETMLPEILRLGAKSIQILIFGAKRLEEIARSLQPDLAIESLLIPESRQRYLINIFRSTWNAE